MKRLILSLAIASTTLLATTASAENPEKAAQKKRPAAAEGRAGRNPEMMVARIIEEFDKDNDQKLDKTELAAWLKAMQQRRGELIGKLGKPGAGKPGAGKLGPGKKGKRAADDQAAPGGDSPKRPESE